jgi:uncharacterized membrane protein
MHYLIAALLLGAIVTWVLPWGSTFVQKFIPASISANVLVQIAVAGVIVLVALIAVHKAGFGKYLKEA